MARPTFGEDRYVVPRMKSRTETCVCGGTIEAVDGLEQVAIRAHMRTEQHVAMFGAARVAANDPYPEPYFNPDRPMRATGPIRFVVGPMPCQGCRESVDVIEYVGGLYPLHPNGLLACPAEPVAR